MCLFPKLIKNKKYTSTIKNGGIVPAVSDPRVLYVPIGCGKCIECCKKKARDWQVRLIEEIKVNTNGKFITLTFSNESIQKLIKHDKIKNLTGYELDNQIATVATRYFLERWRKKFKKSVRHWLITELGHNGTENIHLHGILWTNESYATIRDIWQYGFIWPRPESKIHTWVSNDTINYMTKYVTKIDSDHKYYKPIVLATDGIGGMYHKSTKSNYNKFNNDKTLDSYKTDTGHDIALPIYYRNKLYTDDEKEKLWLHKLDKNERWVCGIKIKANNTNEYFKLLEEKRQLNEQLGYGDDTKDWERIEYENKMRELLLLQRIQNEHGYPAAWDEQ